jgi:tRNA threonylcarbamoyladenosine biosynthesis protein TsaB
MSYKLLIDTSDNKQVRVGLLIHDKEDILIHQNEKWKSQAVLPLIKEILKKHTVRLKDLTAIEVDPGPGSFTGLRVGATIANALGTWLKIPINNKKVGEIVEPVYT